MNKIKGRNKIKTNKGITLIALVITIIILLILATISIATLTGENGILNKADNAKIEEEKASAKEKVQIAVMGSFGNDGNINKSELKTNLDKVEGIKKPIPDIIKLPTTVEVDGYEVTINEDGKVTLGESTGEKPTPNPPTLDLPSTEDTTPYLPERATINEEHNTLEKGLVIKDENNNEWVWIEVPKSIYTNTTYNRGTAPSSSEDYAKIESTMQSYASAYRGSYTDTFYSTDQCGFADATEYNNWKNSMLKSGYEVGTDTARFSGSDALTTPLIQRDKYPYNFVTCRQGQSLSKRLSTGGRISSLMFGIQWDLVMKFIEEKGRKTQAQLKNDSTEWGNYRNANFIIERGKYSIDDGKTYAEVIGSYTKASSRSVVITTGATERNSTLGIYDLAGNVYEWTLEKATNYPCTYRGGRYGLDGSEVPANVRTKTGGLTTHIAFRPALW